MADQCGSARFGSGATICTIRWKHRVAQSGLREVGGRVNPGNAAAEINPFDVVPRNGLDLTPNSKLYNSSAMARSRENGQPAMTIGQVAAALDVPATTLRYYERARIIRPSDRSAAGYRLYDATALERIRFLRAAQAAGFSLADIQTLLDLSDQPQASCRSTVQSLITARLADVKSKISNLTRVQEMLELALARCRRSRNECPVLTELSSNRARGGQR